MATLEYRYDPGANILVPAVPGSGHLEVCAYGPSLTIPAGQAMGQKTSTAKMYPLNFAATDGTQTFKGFNQYSLATDSSSVVYFVVSPTTASPTYVSAPASASAIYTSGIFDPRDLLTAATGTAVAEVDTITPAGSVTTGDVYSVFQAATGIGVEITVGATQTATGAVTLLKAAWTANPSAAAIATASGTATFILTGVASKAGTPLGLTASVQGTGTVSLAITTAAVAAQQVPVYTTTPTGSVTTGDVYTMTLTYPGGQTLAIPITVGATQTATGAVTLWKAAWNANVAAAAVATASGTATFILTGVVPGNSLNLSASVVGTGTVSAVVVTTPALGRAIADILPGAPGARVLSSGFWDVP